MVSLLATLTGSALGELVANALVFLEINFGSKFSVCFLRDKIVEWTNFFLFDENLGFITGYFPL